MDKRPRAFKAKRAYREEVEDDEDSDSSDDDYSAPAINVMTTRVEAAMGSATYHIPRACSVAADNKPHKVRQGLTQTFEISVFRC